MMEAWMVWTIATPLIVLAASFFLLVLFVAIKLIKVVRILTDIQDKLQSINPLCRILYRLGEEADERISACFSKQSHSRAADIAEWVMVGLSFINTFRRRSR